MLLLCRRRQQQEMYNHFNHRAGNRYKSNSRVGRNNRKVKNIPNNKIGRSQKRRIGSIRSNRRSIHRRINLSQRFNSRGGHNNSCKNLTGTKC